MRPHCAVFVDVGYLLSAAATLVTGTSLRRAVHVDTACLIRGLISQAENASALPLLRLRRIAEGPPATPTREFSWGLFYATQCQDSTLPFALTSDLPGRVEAVRQAFAQVPPSAYAPWAPDVYLDSSTAMSCTRFPRQARTEPQPGPMPKVPTLLLSGEEPLPNEQIISIAGTINGEPFSCPGSTCSRNNSFARVTDCRRRAMWLWTSGRY